jgi:hypothetical protein
MNRLVNILTKIELDKDKQTILSEYDNMEWGDLDIIYMDDFIVVKREDVDEWNKRIEFIKD